LVQTVHNDLPHDTGLRFKAAFTRLYRMADALICHTAQSRERMAEEFGIPLRKIHVIPHGPLNMARSDPRAAARVRSQFGISADTVMVLCQGFIRPYKGIAFLLEAWRRVQGRGTNARLIIAGGGDPELIQNLKFQAKGCGIESTVHFATYFLTVDDLGAFYQAADILVYPYRAITMSGSLMTGVTFRRPIVATKLPAFEQMLRHGETALLIDYGDVEGMAGALGHLIDDPAERRRLGEAAGTVASSQSWEEIARATLQCYEDARNLREP
jgi:glycosyltransferase involved in cell wall biosynthesis